MTATGQPRERLYLFDTTLRDGAQTLDVDFSLNEKLRIATLLDELGVDYIEAGYPGANPTDTAFFAQERPANAKITAFGMTRRAGRSLSNDPGIRDLLNARSDAICFVAKSWDYHVRLALGVTNDENLDGIARSVEAAVAAGKEVLVDCEHFFDGYKADPSYALACARAGVISGARWVVLCDTNGGSLPHEIAAIVKAAGEVVPGCSLGIHAHDDLGQAVANSLAAVDAGARQIQGTLNGVGERCGNTNLATVIPTLILKSYYRDRFDIGVSPEQLAGLTHISRVFDDILNRAPDRQAPYVGDYAFATKAGIHASALVKDPTTYEHAPPEATGNRRRILVSAQAGRSNLLAALTRAGIAIDRQDPRLEALLGEIKSRENEGYAYDLAEASFELLARRRLGAVPEYFTVDGFRALAERRFNAKGQLVVMSEAVIKMTIAGRNIMSVAEGNGPVNALDEAFRKDLGVYQRYVDDLELADYKVRIIGKGTTAVTRVLIESRDGDGRRWFTVGVSSNIVDASFQALLDSVVYKLLRDQAPAPDPAPSPGGSA